MTSKAVTLSLATVLVLALSSTASAVSFTLNSVDTLFGPSTSAGNTLMFGEPDFEATSDANPISTGDADITITAGAGEAITQIIVEERGSYSIFGVGDVAAALDGFLTINSVDMPTQSSSFTSSNASGLLTGGWNKTLTFTFSPASEVDLDFTNTLFALASNPLAPGLATIAKDRIEITAVVTAIPEPSSLFALSCMTGSCVLTRRRRSR